MILVNATATVTSRGQVTLPKLVRKVLDSRTIEFEVRGDLVMVRSVQSVACSLATYARKKAPLADVRDAVWKEVARAKAQSRPS
jgi:bifunctional DNA-binding transcriptional regulator/antitoxin component of YhaV-PrlF toxin-antitoxin module